MSALAELTERQQEILSFIQHHIAEQGFPPTVREIGAAFGIRSTNGVADHLKSLERKGYLERNGHKSRALRPVRVEEPDPAFNLDFVYKHEETERPPTALRGFDNVTPLRPRHPAHQSVEATETFRADAPDVEEPLDTVEPIGSGRLVSVPILGRVAAGVPILAEEHAEDTVQIDSVLLGSPARRVFALRVVGDSMIGDGIFDGDFIFVKKQLYADDGQIVVVMVENEATVKRLYREGDRVRLQPSNPRLSPIYVAASEFRDTQILGAVVGVYRKTI